MPPHIMGVGQVTLAQDRYLPQDWAKESRGQGQLRSGDGSCTVAYRSHLDSRLWLRF